MLQIYKQLYFNIQLRSNEVFEHLESIQRQILSNPSQDLFEKKKLLETLG